jgi:predicted nuclease of predicted toxin-antitoxin system
VKLLFDENLSPRLVERLVDVYPESKHVSGVGLTSD